jgi:hypothetical protein
MAFAENLRQVMDVTAHIYGVTLNVYERQEFLLKMRLYTDYIGAHFKYIGYIGAHFKQHK